MSSTNLNPGVDLGLSPEVVAVEQQKYPRELGMESLIEDPAKPVKEFDGIIDIGNAKNTLKNSSSNPATEPALDVPAMSLKNEYQPTQEAIPETPASTPIIVSKDDGQNNQTMLLVAFVLFLISLAAASYFVFKYFFS